MMSHLVQNNEKDSWYHKRDLPRKLNAESDALHQRSVIQGMFSLKQSLRAGLLLMCSEVCIKVIFISSLINY